MIHYTSNSGYRGMKEKKEQLLFVSM
uniref:Uncharacterized protein n=1 Tax=Arundo donax TaxID=35708 RepID=A0A0A8YU24_ARUDO